MSRSRDGVGEGPFRFEEREIQDHALPVAREELVAGRTYFVLSFADEELLVPLLEPVVFVGRGIAAASGPDDCLFQDYASYVAGVRYGSERENDAYFQSGDTVNCVFEFERALDLLMLTSLRRRAMRSGGEAAPQ